MATKRRWRRLLAVLLTLALMCSLSVQAFAASLPADAGTAEEETVSADMKAAAAALMEQRKAAGLVKADLDDLDPDATIRVMVETKATPAVQAAGTMEWNARTQQAEMQALRKQESVAAQVEKITGNGILNQSAFLVSTFTTEMTVAEMEEVAALPDVVSVTPVTTFEMKMNYATSMTTVTKMWEELGYTGEGTVIAVIDSGVNYQHPDMVLSDGVEPKITEADAQEIIDTLGYGQYYSEKVPFGYSYCGYYEMDNSSTTHGLHVAGIAAGNGGEDGITGVAPDAQVLGLQVFGMSGSAFTDDILRAVEDGVKLGADIMNLSLGSTAGFYDDVAYLQSALDQATEEGILCCVAAGNDGTSASLLGINTNDFGVVDAGAVSAPSTAPGALSVASVNNTYVKGATISVTDAEGNEYETTAFNFSSYYDDRHAEDPEEYGWDTLDDVTLVDCGLGTMDELSEMFDYLFMELEGSWVALVQRGDISFQEKIENCYNMGASGVIVYNNVPGDAVPFNVSSEDAGTSSWKLYQLMVSNNFGLKLLELAGTQVSFGDLVTKFVAASDAGEMSTFSSWGTTASLDIKPEISAPGGNIYSVSSGSGYEVMSGTSMATPYVSGASALVIQALKEAIANGELDLNDLNMAQYVKLALMNTADPVCEEDGTPYSVRQQGAGMVDPLGAANNRVLATVDGLASAALKEISATATFTITLTNYGTEDASYTLGTDALYTDAIEGEDNLWTVAPIAGTITYSAASVAVPAGGTATVEATVSSDGAEYGHFVEGFATLTGDDCETLSLPVLGFYGDWFAAENIIDAPMYTGESVYMTQGMLSTSVAAGDIFAGMNEAGETIPEYISFSPNGDLEMDTAFPILGLLRSAETMTVEVLNGNMVPIRTLMSTTQIPKLLAVDYADQNGIYTILTDSMQNYIEWDGTVYDQRSGKYVACDEGQYYLSVTATLPGFDGEQTVTMPVKIDLTAPSVHVETVERTEDGIAVSFTASDNVAVYDAILVYVNGEENKVLLDDCAYEEETGVYTAEVPCEELDETAVNEFGVYVVDYAGNGALDYYYTNVDENAILTYSTVTNAEDSWYESYTLYDRSDIGWLLEDDPHAFDDTIFTYEIRGVANSAVTSLSLDGEEIPLSARGGFDATVIVEEGQNAYHVVAKDAQGNVLADEYKLIYMSFGSNISARFYPTCYPDQMDALCPATHRPASGWIYDVFGDVKNTFGYSTRYATEVPLICDAEGDIGTVTITYFDPAYPMDSDLMAETYELYDHIPGAHYQTQTLTAEDFVDGKAEFSLPMVHIDGFDFVEYPVEDQSQYEDLRWNEAYITITDVLGVQTRFLVRVFNDQYTKLEEELGWLEDYNILDDPDSIMTYMGFKYLSPLDSMDYPYIFTPDDVDENGCIHVEGEAADPGFTRIYANGQKVNEGESTTFSFDYKLLPGINVMSIITCEDGGWNMSYGYQLAYLPEPTTITFDQSAIEDGAYIRTDSSTFDISGSISSYFMGKNLTINGDSVLMECNSLTSPNGEPATVSFQHTVKLMDGLNVITVELTDAMNQTTTVTFTVRKTGTTPVTPVEPTQPSGEDGKCDGGAACPSAKFTDVDRNAWYHEYLDYVVTNGLMNGTSASTFAPNATTTRAMVVSILYRLAGSPAVSGANPFADVAAGSWCENAVIWGYENGIVKGFDESTFAPDATITRQQMAAFLYRYAAFCGKDVSAKADLGSFADASAVSANLLDAMQWAVAEGILNGTTSGLLDPNGGATRAQFAAVLTRYAQ